MDGAETIRTALERNVRAVTRRPAVGQGTARTVARLQDGLECRVTDGAHALTVGMTEKYGGTDAGPNPGVLGRAALASCLAMGYAMWAARMDVPLDALEVEVQADYDVRGELGVDGSAEEDLEPAGSARERIRPGYLEVRYIVTVKSPAPREQVIAVLDRCDATSSYLDIFAQPVPLRRVVKFREGEG